MKRFIAGEDRQQITLLPDCPDNYITAGNPVRLVEVFVDELDLPTLGFAGAVPEATGRPAYHPAILLKNYLHGSLDGVPSARTREPAQHRADLADRSAAARLQDAGQLPQGQRFGHPGRLRAVRGAVPPAEPVQSVVAIDGSKFKAWPLHGTGLRQRRRKGSRHPSRRPTPRCRRRGCSDPNRKN